MSGLVATLALCFVCAPLSMESARRLAEERLAQLSQTLEQRVTDRTLELAVANEQLRAEVAARRASEDPEGFWEAEASELEWYKKWDRVLDDSNKPFFRWFPGGQTNIVHNCLDRHVLAGRGDKVAIHWEGEPGDRRTLTYFDLYRHVQEPRGRATRLIDFFADPHDEDGVLTLLRFVDREAQAADSDKIRVYHPELSPTKHFRASFRQALFYGYGIFKGEPNPHHVSVYQKFNSMQSMSYQVIMLLLVGILVARRSSGSALRALALGLVMLALANPTLKEEQRENLGNIAIVVVDE